MPFFQGATNFEVNNPTFNDIKGNFYATNNSQYTNIQDSFNSHRTNYVNSGNDNSRTYGASRPKHRQSKSAGDALGNISQGYAPRGRGPQTAPPAPMGPQTFLDNSWMQNLPQPPPGQPAPGPNSAFADIPQHQTNRPQPGENQWNDGQDAGQEAFSDMSNADTPRRKKKKKKKQTQLPDLGEDLGDQGMANLGEEIANEIRNDLKNGLQASAGGTTVTNTNSFNTTTTNHQNAGNNYSTNITASGSGPIQLPQIPMRNPHAPVQPPPPAMAAPSQQPPQGQVPLRPTAHPVQNNQGQPPAQNFQPPPQHNQGQPQQGQQQPQSMPQLAPLQNQGPIHQEPQSYVSEPQGVGMPTPEHFTDNANNAGTAPEAPSMFNTVSQFLGDPPASAEQKKKKKNWFRRLFSKKKKKGTDTGLEATGTAAESLGV